jgi:hypothetical protein
MYLYGLICSRWPSCDLTVSYVPQRGVWILYGRLAMAVPDEESSGTQPVPGALLPDVPVNAEPIEAVPGGLPRLVLKRAPEGRFRELSWAVFGGLGPFLVALIVHASIVGWSLKTIDPSNLGYSLFALSLAAIVRIISHGSGKDLVPVLMFCGILQMAVALYFGGVFDAGAPSGVVINDAVARIERSQTASAREMQQAVTLLDAVENNDHAPSATAYVSLAGTGLLVLAIMLRFWAPSGIASV